MALLDDIITHLVANGVATEGKDLFKHEIPDQPDKCVAIFEYQGSPPDQYLARPGLQVRTRSKSADEARQLAQSIENVLHDQAELVINGHRYLRILAVGSPTPQGRDDSKRMEFVQNYTILMERVN